MSTKKARDILVHDNIMQEGGDEEMEPFFVTEVRVKGNKVFVHAMGLSFDGVDFEFDKNDIVELEA